ncbi:MAG TPA: CoA transferase [Dehalococcoidia bacterium]|nr:CoA transferase [Dehalococcoidia bacterium]
MDLPLEGIRVVDLTVIWAGPYATELLGDLGAEVIRVESLRHFPTNTRGYWARPARDQVLGGGPFGRCYPDLEPGDRPWDRYAIFNAHGRNKLSATMDLTTPRGKEMFLRLIERSDIFIENNAAKVTSQLGITWDVLSAVNPRLIMLSMPGFGVHGPYADYQGFGANAEAVTGLASLRGYRGDDPSTLTGTFYMDAASAPGAIVALMAALLWRDRTGRGQFIELAQAEQMLPHIGGAIVDYTLNGRVRRSLGNRDPAVIQGVYQCAGEDKWVAITICDAAWAAFCRVIGRPELIEDDRFTDSLSRYRHHDEVDEIIVAWTRQRDQRTVMKALQAAGVAAGPVLDEPGILADPQLAAREFFHWIDHPQAGRHRYPGHVWQLGDRPLPFRPAPTLGQDNEYVYKQVLGVSDEEYAGLVADGQIGDSYAPEVR